MAAYLMFCTYAPEAMKVVNTKGIDEALALIKKYGGELETGPATGACLPPCRGSVVAFDKLMAS